MVRISFWWGIAVGLVASLHCVHAQIAPDIARGTTSEQVIRTHGWPKGKGVNGARETWVYDKFQVLLENDRVVQVTPAMPPPPSARRTAPTQPLTQSQPPSRPNPTSPVVSQPVTRPTATLPAAVTTPPVAPKTTLTPSQSPRSSAQAQPARPSAPPPMESLTWTIVKNLWWFALTMAGLSALAAALKRQQRRNHASSAAARRETPAMPPMAAKTFQEHIAERLASMQKPASPRPPPFAGPPADAAELTPELLRRLEWKRFEQLVALYYNETGVRAECTRIGADGGVDVYLYRAGQGRPYCYVQCKAWGSRVVKVDEMRALFGVMAAQGVRDGVFATTSDFSADARAFARQNNIALVDADELVTQFGKLAEDVRRRILTTITAGDFTTPTCPQCDTKMIWKESAGFWGCPSYPRCRSKPIYPRST